MSEEIIDYFIIIGGLFLLSCICMSICILISKYCYSGSERRSNFRVFGGEYYYNEIP